MDPANSSASEPPSVAAAAFVAELQALLSPNTAAIRGVRRRRSRAWKTLPAEQVLTIAGKIATNRALRWTAYEIIRFHPGAFALLDDARVAALAAGLDSWGSVDAFARILSGPAWARGLISDSLIDCWARSPDRWLRRAALVSTIELRDASRVLPWCRLLAADRDDMVVKALSWALRELGKGDAAAVRAFLVENEARLAARVKREVADKLRTGLKNPRGR